MLYRPWMLRVALVLALVLGIAALANTVDVPTVSPTSRPTAEMNSHDYGEVTTGADVTYAVERGQSEDLVEQAAICLLIPQCFRNSDCDALCGPRLGRCVHNPCPARVCTCR